MVHGTNTKYFVLPHYDYYYYYYYGSDCIEWSNKNTNYKHYNFAATIRQRAANVSVSQSP